MTVTNLAQADWDRLGPSLADAIVDTLIMVSTTPVSYTHLTLPTKA